MSDATAKGSFFRQSAWMILATVGSGLAMMLVHTLVSKRAGATAFAEFRALLSSFYVITAASGGLWTLFAQQTAAAVTPKQRQTVAATARSVLVGIAGVWLMLAGVLFFSQGWLTDLWKLTNPASLWATWALGLVSLCAGVTRGLVQGRQQFLELGWMAIFDGVGRLVAVWVALTVFAGLAAGTMTAAVIGTTAALAMGLRGARNLLFVGGGRADWRPWLQGFIPLAGSAAAVQMIQQYDQIFWQALIPKAQIEFWKLGSQYMPAQAIGFALTQFTVPLALVMMPRLSRSAATGEKSDALRVGLVATVLLGGCAALACTAFPALPLQIMFFNNSQNWAAAPLVPWFAWAMSLFALANVYLNDLFARRRFAVVWGVVALCALYVGTLQILIPRLLTLEPMLAFRCGVQTLLGFCVALLALTAAFSKFTRGDRTVAEAPPVKKS